MRVTLCALALASITHAQSDPRSQADRVAARIKALQVESDTLASQARTVFGELRRLELEREIKQDEVAKADIELARVTAERDRAEQRVAELEAIRIAQTPGVKERLVELSKRGRAGYVQLLLSSDDVRAMGRMARGVAAVAELVNRWPDVRWVLAGGRLSEIQGIGRRLGRASRAWFDIARVQGPMDGVRMLRESIGVPRLLFGTDLPFILAESPIMELGDARLPEEEDAAVRHRNAAAALGIE